MEFNDFDKRLVEKIKDKKISPYPRWHFLLKKYVVWGSGLISLLIGAAAISVMIYFVEYSGWELHLEMHQSLSHFLLLTLPYFWFIFLGIFLFILSYNLQHTSKAYRYPPWQIIGASILVSIILGITFFSIGLGSRIDDRVSGQVPFYSTVINRQLVFWFDPDEGRLVGVISSKNIDQSFNIIDPRGQTWQIILPASNTSSSILKVGQSVFLIGQSSINGRFNKFQAITIKTVHSGRGFFRQTQFSSHFHPTPSN